jgi:hypothetical protein
VAEGNLRVLPDSPPTVKWQAPNDDLYVTSSAVVPIELVVNDDLAIHTVELTIERTETKGNKNGRTEARRVELYRGTDKAVAASDDAAANRDDNRKVAHSLDIAAMKLPVGAELALHAEAADYRPGTGRTAAPRRITVITRDELDARLADRQAQIVRQLEQALSAERTTRQDVRRLELQQRDAGELTAGDRNALQSAELNQRRVHRLLVDPMEGMPVLIDALMTELRINQLPASNILASMRELRAALDRLATDPLSSAERELTTARKAAEAMADNKSVARLARSLANAGAAQDLVIVVLEQLLGELTDWADFRRFVRQLAELRQDQIAHEQTSRTELELETLPLEVRELSRSQRANLAKAAAGQDSLARRYEKIEQGMDMVARQLADEEETAAQLLDDAVALARHLAIGSKMRDTTHDLNANRVGVALERELQIAAELEQVLDVLRNRGENSLDQLVNKLRQTETRLAALRQQAAALRELIALAEKQGRSADIRQLQQLKAQQEQLRRAAKQLARQLNRIQADAAGRSTQSAADRLKNRPSDAGETAASLQRPSSSNEVRQAENDLAEAARHLAQRREEAEFDLALELVRRFQTELQEMVVRQQEVVRDTIGVDHARVASGGLATEQSQKLEGLADTERELAKLTREHSEVLDGLGAVRESLQEAGRRLDVAAQLLSAHESSAPTQHAERHALKRLEGMLDAFSQTAKEAGGSQSNGGAGGQRSEQRRPTFELLEVKMLRMLQVDLNERTQDYERRFAGPPQQVDPEAEAALRSEAQELAAEQGRLAGLVKEILSRDNQQDRE